MAEKTSEIVLSKVREKMIKEYVEESTYLGGNEGITVKDQLFGATCLEDLEAFVCDLHRGNPENFYSILEEVLDSLILKEDQSGP